MQCVVCIVTCKQYTFTRICTIFGLLNAKQKNIGTILMVLHNLAKFVQVFKAVFAHVSAQNYLLSGCPKEITFRKSECVVQCGLYTMKNSSVWCVVWLVN